MTGVIICGGKIENYTYVKKYIQDADIIICADSGLRHCKFLQVSPDILLGDFDSVSSEDLKAFESAGINVLRYPVEKDMTDSELAIEIAVQKGCNKVILLGALGTRLDHSISNVLLLKKLTDRGVEGILADEHNEVRLINSTIEIVREENTFITLLPIDGNAEGVTTEGLYYPLKDATLKTGSSWGVSNRFSAEKASVRLKKGYLLVVKARD